MSYRSVSGLLLLCCVWAALTFIFPPEEARAIDFRWIDVAGGWFDTASNWDQGAGYPGVNDKAIFDIYGNYTVEFWYTHTNMNLEQDKGIVTFELYGRTYTVTSTTYLGYDTGDSTQLTVTNGDVASSYVYLGYSGTAQGLLTVSNGGAWSSSEGIYVGTYNQARGTLAIAAGSSVSADWIDIGLYDDSTGAVNVTGVGAQLNVSGSLYAGYYASGTLNVCDGGAVTSNSGYIGYDVDADATQQPYGKVIISGDDSSWTNSSSLTIGDSEGTMGSLEITSGASLSNAAAYVGSDSGASGTVKVSGTGSQWTNSSTLYVGNRGNGIMRIDGGASVSNTVGFLGKFSGSEGAATVTGPDSEWINSNVLYVGDDGSGSLEIADGGRVSNTYGYMAFGEGSGGIVNVSGYGSQWSNLDAVYVGFQGDAVLNIANGATVSNTVGYVGYTSMSRGEVNVSESGSRWNNSSVLYVGLDGAGSLNITNGADVSDTTGHIGCYSGSSGEVTVSGTGSTWNNSDSLYVGGLSYSAGGSGSLTVGLGGTVLAPGTLKVWSTGTVNLSGGTIETGQFVMTGGAFYFTAGTLKITDSTLFLSDSGPLGETLDLAAGMHVDVTQSAYMDIPALLRVGDGASFQSDTLVNYGEVQLDGSTALLGGTTLLNHALLTGEGRIQSALNNQLGGEVRGESGRRLLFTAAGNINSGEINLAGGSVDFQEDLTNDANGFISGRGELRADGGLTNDGAMAFSGGFTDVYGDVANNASGRIVVSGGSTTTFFDDVHNDGEIRVSAACNAVFFGALSGNGDMPGTGTVYVEGDLRPGNSPAEISFGGDLILGGAATLVIDLAGANQGEYDVVNVADALSLDGTLDVKLQEGFRPSHGDVFEILTFDSREGDFSECLGLDLGGRLTLERSFTSTSMVLTAIVDAVPGDANRDEKVDDVDAGALAANWQTSIGATWEMGDFNGDGAVNDVDATMLAVNWLSGVHEVVPEPSTLAGLLGLCLCLAGISALRGRPFGGIVCRIQQKAGR